jgi:hypothetical protein
MRIQNKAESLNIKAMGLFSFEIPSHLKREETFPPPPFLKGD